MHDDANDASGSEEGGGAARHYSEDEEEDIEHIEHETVQQELVATGAGW